MAGCFIGRPFFTSKMRWASRRKIDETLVEYRFCKYFNCLGIIKTAKTWLCSQPGALYFYIINGAKR
ncbi:hypothetical protein A4D02_25020 [Niastella koreensis]|uniref:Uncharacterized protein n=1 Tax=Niastella koreensis TaxID=354356 RepID=A0ABX3NZU8_9BACT|nr:hypothetical protein A4D02_25020 [Niastella koreensis]